MSHSARGRADLPALRKELPNLNLGPQAGSGPGRQGHGLQTVGDGITVAEEALGVCGRGPWRRSGALQVALGGQALGQRVLGFLFNAAQDAQDNLE